MVAKPDDARIAFVVAARAPRRLRRRLAARLFRTRLRFASGFALRRTDLRTAGVDPFAAAARFALRRLVVGMTAATAFCAAARLALGRLAV